MHRLPILSNPNPQSLGRGFTPPLPLPVASARGVDPTLEGGIPFLGPFGCFLSDFEAELRIIFDFLSFSTFQVPLKNVEEHVLSMNPLTFWQKNRKMHPPEY